MVNDQKKSFLLRFYSLLGQVVEIFSMAVSIMGISRLWGVFNKKIFYCRIKYTEICRKFLIFL